MPGGALSPAESFSNCKLSLTLHYVPTLLVVLHLFLFHFYLSQLQAWRNFILIALKSRKGAVSTNNVWREPRGDGSGGSSGREQSPARLQVPAEPLSSGVPLKQGQEGKDTRVLQQEGRPAEGGFS